MKRKHLKMLIKGLIVIVYVILKIYVLNTPETKDNDVPDVLIELLPTLN